MVAEKLSEDWSPEQISGWLKLAYPHDEGMRVSHEAIYQSLFVQARGALKKELTEHLRTRRTIRRSRHASLRGKKRGQIQDAVSIRERPAEAEDRAVPGHWEGDLLSGSRNSHVATLVERSTRFVMLLKLDGKHAPRRGATPSPRASSGCPRSCANADRGSRAGDGRAQELHHRHQRAESTFAIRAAPGSAAATRTSTACCGSTFPNAATSSPSPRTIWTPSPGASTPDPERRSAFRTPGDMLEEAIVATTP